MSRPSLSFHTLHASDRVGRNLKRHHDFKSVPTQAGRPGLRVTVCGACRDPGQAAKFAEWPAQLAARLPKSILILNSDGRRAEQAILVSLHGGGYFGSGPARPGPPGHNKLLGRRPAGPDARKFTGESRDLRFKSDWPGPGTRSG